MTLKCCYFLQISDSFNVSLMLGRRLVFYITSDWKHAILFMYNLNLCFGVALSLYKLPQLFVSDHWVKLTVAAKKSEKLTISNRGPLITSSSELFALQRKNVIIVFVAAIHIPHLSTISA